MGIYVFDADYLYEALEARQRQPGVEPRLRQGHHSRASWRRGRRWRTRSSMSCVRSTAAKPSPTGATWARSMHTGQANLDLTRSTARARHVRHGLADLDLPGAAAAGQVRASTTTAGAAMRSTPWSRAAASSPAPRCAARCCFPACASHSFASINESVLLPDVDVGVNCRLYRVVIDRACLIPAGHGDRRGRRSRCRGASIAPSRAWCWSPATCCWPWKAGPPQGAHESSLRLHRAVSAAQDRRAGRRHRRAAAGAARRRLRRARAAARLPGHPRGREPKQAGARLPAGTARRRAARALRALADPATVAATGHLAGQRPDGLRARRARALRPARQPLRRCIRRQRTSRFALLGWAAACLGQGSTRTGSPRCACHDWHAGTGAGCTCGRCAMPGPPPAASVFTVHNLAYQGIFPRSLFAATGPAATTCSASTASSSTARCRS